MAQCIFSGFPGQIGQAHVLATTGNYKPMQAASLVRVSEISISYIIVGYLVQD